jgi:Uma2 family endonuclease
MMATAVLPTTRITPEQLLTLPDRERYELVNGELVEMPAMSLEGAAIGNRLGSRLQAFVEVSKLGVVLNSDASYQCFLDDPNRIRRPDVSFIRKGRLSDEQFEQGHCLIAPVFAVEIVSPNDILYDVEEKIEEYLAAGVELVWMISPKSRSITVYRLHGKAERFDGGALAGGEAVLPGFEIRVSELFPDKKTVL